MHAFVSILVVVLRSPTDSGWSQLICRPLSRCVAAFNANNLVIESVLSSASARPCGGSRPNSSRHLLWVSFAKILSGRDINNLRAFLNPPVCYDCGSCSTSFVCGSEPLLAVFAHAETCSRRIWRSGNNSRC
jgi:hypothetical protein